MRPAGSGNRPRLLASRFLLGRMKAIAAIVLGAIERGVGAQQQRIDIGRGIVGGGGADADGSADRLGADSGAGNFKACANTLGNARHHFHRFGYDGGEFLATEPADNCLLYTSDAADEEDSVDL